MKLKVLVAGVFIFLSAVGTGFYLKQSQIPLLSPAFNNNHPPDLTNKLNQKIAEWIPLDYSSSTQPKGLLGNISYLVYNSSTHKVYAAKGSSSRISPASFTKLMTGIIALDIASPTQLLSTTPKSIAKEPTVLGLKTNEQLTITELIRGSISTSANDAAATLGEGVASIYNQNLEFFVSLMNNKAKLMNMNNTHFVNPEGYDDNNQYSTLEDLSKLIHNVQQNYPDIVAAGSADREDLVATSTHGFYYLPNWNGLLGVYPGVTGLKIAYTENAGYSTIITATREGIPITAVLVGANNIKQRDDIASQLLDVAFQQEEIDPIELSPETIQERYDTWADLANQIRSELATQSAEQQ